MRFSVALLVIILLLPGHSKAFHIIGGELYYTCLGGNNYQITLKVYRDCNSTTQYDDTAFIGIYNAGNLVQDVGILFPGSTLISPDQTNPCLEIPPNICVEEAIYVTTVNLLPLPGGYDIAYQRCCRNSTIANILDPQNTGATYTAHIPDNSIVTCNSSPHFTNYPPIVICVNETLIFDHSATDPDGDSLVYSLFTPYQGADAVLPKPNPPPPPPYAPVTWVPPYNLNDQLGGIPPMSIDPQTGVLTASPNALGQYVVGICVKEYRNGVYLGQGTRDFQFNITTCNLLIEADFDAANAPGNDTLLLCGNYTVNFTNLSYGSNDFAWDFGVPGITTDVSTDVSPTYTYPDTGVYKVMLAASPGITCGDTIYKYVEIRLGVNTDFSFQSECVNSPIQFTDQSVPIDGTVNGWNWDFGDGNTSLQQNPSHAFSNPGIFNVTLTAQNNYGCTATIVKPVEVYPLPVINAEPDTFICDIDSVTLHASGGTTYQWSPNYNINNTSIDDPLVQPDVTTVYSVTVTSSNGCVNTDSVTVMITDTVISESGVDTTVCEGSPVQLYANNAVYYAWNPNDGLNNAFVSSPIATPEVTTTYYVKSYIGSCFDEDTVTITVLPVPDADAGPDVTINQGEQTQLNATGGDNYQWLPADSLSNPNIADPLASPINSITYTVTISNSDGCKSSDTVLVTVTHLHLLYVPNAFTPNGDGLNDYFNFYAKGIKKILSVQIFNRWGQQVYSSDGNDEGWDGTFKGKTSELGVYVYEISAITYDGDLLEDKGTLTLLR